MLVGILKGPSEFNPRRNPDKVLERRNLVIDLMAHHQIISVADAEPPSRHRWDCATAVPGRAASTRRSSAGAPPVAARLPRGRPALRGAAHLHDARPAGPGRRRRGRERAPAALDKKRGLPVGTLETAAVVTSVAQGEVLALVGGRDPGYAGFNRALDAVRPIGSLIKPVIYLTALSQPERYSLVTPSRTCRCLRVPAASCGAEELRPQRARQRAALSRAGEVLQPGHGQSRPGTRGRSRWPMLQDLGAVRDIDTVPAMLLGSVSLPPIEVAQVYQTIAAGGFRAPLRAIREVLDASGRPLNRYPLGGRARGLRGGRLPDAVGHAPSGHPGHRDLARQAPARRLGGGGQDRHHQRHARQLVRRLQRRQGGRGLGRPRRQQAHGPERFHRRVARLGRYHGGHRFPAVAGTCRVTPGAPAVAGAGQGRWPRDRPRSQPHRRPL
jgi:penicillin-binding protein 1B